VLKGVDVRFEAGTSVAVTGTSGSGKSVLLHVLSGMLEPTRGEVRIDGVPLSPDHGASRRRFGIVLQSAGLVSGLTVSENVSLPLQVRALQPADMEERIRSALAAVDLTEVAAREVDTLSGGQRQRVGVARALAGAPEIVLADEPTSELDPVNATRVLAALLGEPSGRIVVIASNDANVVRACDRVLVLRDGVLSEGAAS
jgi:putative ABC transport system ATP-binding protein